MDTSTTSEYGYFVDSDDEDDVETEAEPRARYAEGLYYPIRIGEALDGRYQVIHKLGWGGFSTVWLAHDHQCDNRAVALKILIPGSGQTEREIENAICRAVQDPSGFVTYLAAFYLPGVNGTSHMVLVYPVRGPSLRSSIGWKLDPAIRMAGARQLLVTLKTLHDAGIIHKDIKTANIMWHIDPVEQWTVSDLYRRFGQPRKAKLPEALGKPGELVEPMRIPDADIGLPLYLGDFGLSFRSSYAVGATIQTPIAFCAPERYHGIPPSFAGDVWSYTTIFASLYLGADVLPGEGTGCISRLVAMMGPFPESWKSLYSGGTTIWDWWYDHIGQAVPPRILSLNTLESKLAYLRPETTRLERQYFLSVVRRGWSYEPETRATALQMLEDPTFKALMAFYGL